MPGETLLPFAQNPFCKTLGVKARAGEWELALQWLLNAEGLGLASVEVFNAALSACAKARAWPAALALLASELALAADAVTYSTAVSACERGGSWPWCLRLLAEMRSLRHRPDVSAHQSAAWCSGRAGRWRAAVEGLGEARSHADVGLWSATVWACEAARAAPPPMPAALADVKRKEASVLDFVKRRSEPGDLDSVLRAIERFAGECSWLKVAGGPKAKLLSGCLRPGDRILEFGAYVGYSALTMVRHLRRLGGGGRVVSCEVDAGNARVARATIAWAGAAGEAEVRVGRAADWLSLRERLGQAELLVLDHRGTVYHEDLAAAEPLLACGARVLADNVLLPGAPLFLCWVEERHDVAIHDVPEFMRPDLDDWIVVSAPRRSASAAAGSSAARRDVRRDFRRLSAEVDAISWRSMREPVDWRAFQERLAPALRRWREECGL
uniref:catechol O-methyltransferase n=2 Tax=Alexandrium monilatum TaxID=311494 RepID=A0A7S4VKR5_9DINO